MRADARGVAPLVWAGAHSHDETASATEVSGLQRALGRALRRPSPRDADQLAEHGRLLFDLLLPGPVKAALRTGQGGSLRVIGGDGVPWAALHDGVQFLGLRWSIGALLTAEGLSPATTTGADRLLVVADPAGDLPAARYEGEALTRDLSRRSLALDLRMGRLRRADFLRLFSRFRIVHYAGHADPEDEHLPGWRMADGRVGATEFAALAGGASPDLVFANACSSAAWLGPTLLRTGVRHVVATRVDLPDLPGAEFATVFYGELRGGATIGAALRAARIAAANSGSAVWAAYQLFGDPGSVYFRATRPTHGWAHGVRRGVVVAVRPALGAETAEGMLEVHEAWRRRVRETVSSHGGRLLAGRSVCDRAVFGVPTSYENDAVRAARAALELAVPGAVVALEAGPLMATGVDVVGPAAVAAETACWSNEPGCHVLPGALKRLGRRARLEGTRLLGLSAEGPAESLPPLVGRVAELDSVVGRAQQVIDTGAAQAITLIGPAGQGKSRLTQAVEARLQDRMQVLRGAGLPYGEGGPFAAAAGILKGLLGLPGDAPAERLAAALSDLVETLDAEADSGAPDEILSIDDLLAGRAPRDVLQAQKPVLQAMLGLETEGAPTGSAPAAFCALIEAAARRRPLLLVFEDLHWMPAAGQALVEALVSELDGAAICVLSTARPDLATPAPAWFASPHHHRLDLGPLSARAAESVLRQVLGTADDATVQALAARGEGNPLFLRELALQGTEGDDEVPPTVQAVVQARFDRLPGPQKDVLRAAAIFGRTFWLEGVSALVKGEVEAALGALQRAGFVAPDAESGLPDQTQWRFAHALQYEVVFEGLGRRAQAAWHSRAALWLMDEVPAGRARWRGVARHWSAAGDDARAAQAWLEAAAADHAEHAPVEARTALAAALAADDSSGALAPEMRAKAEQDLAALATVAGDLAAAADALDAAVERSQDRVAKAERMRVRAEVDEARGEHGAARARLAEARALLLQVDAPGAERVRVLVERDEAWLLFLEGAYGDAARILRELLPRTVGDEVTSSLNNVLGVVLPRLGELDEAEQAAKRALALARRMGDLARESKYLLNLATIHQGRHAFAEAQECYRRTLELQVRIGDRDNIARTYLNLGTLYGGWGKLEQAGRYLEEAARMRERSGHSELAVALANLGEVRVLQGDFDAAAGYVERAIALCQDGVGPGYLLPDAWRMLAELHLKRGQAEAGIQAAREALSLAEDSADPQRRGVAQRVLGEGHALAGDPASADVVLAAAVETLSAVDEPVELGRALAARARIPGTDPAALQAQARALFESVGAEQDLAALDR